MSSKLKKVLVINTGSSSLKFMLFDITTEEMLAKGLVERIGTPKANFVYQRSGNPKIAITVVATNHTDAVKVACEALVDQRMGVLKDLSEVDAIGHRVVHGGEEFSQPTRITEPVKECIRSCSVLAPLHNPANLEGIRACETVFPGTPNVAVFDTAFHQSMPEHTYMYAIPKSCYKEFGVRKYGFHGTSHKFVTSEAAKMLGKPVDQLKIITCHLGNGSSFAAIDGGKVLDTTMGLTPLAGVIMGTRSGDIDPGVIFYLHRQGMSLDEINSMLNKESGLLAMAGTGSGDMRELVNAVAAGSEEAAMALNMFAHRAALYIGGYNTVLGGVDAIIMTGGIGENSAPAREAIIGKLKGMGCTLDTEANKAAFGKAGRITTADSTTPVYVMLTNEELMIARETVQTLS